MFPSPMEILYMNTVFFGAFIVALAVLLRKEYTENVEKYRANLEKFRNENPKTVLYLVKRSIEQGGGQGKSEEEILNEISGWTTYWSLSDFKASELLKEEKKVINMVKYIIIFFAVTYFVGILVLYYPQEIGFLIVCFLIEVSVSLYWLWIFVSFYRKLTSISIDAESVYKYL